MGINILGKVCESTVSSRDRKKRSRVYLSGAGVREVGDRIDGAMKGESAAPLACVSVGENDISRVTSEELRGRFRKALGRVRAVGWMPLIC